MPVSSSNKFKLGHYPLVGGKVGVTFVEARISEMGLDYNTG